MTSMINLRTFVSKYVSLTEEEFEYFESFFEIRHFKKKELLIREGEVEKYLNYIDSGSAMLFFLKGKEEIAMEFAIENDVIGCFNSFFSKKPSHFSIEAMEPLTVFSLTHENLETLFAYSVKIETLGRLFTREAYLRKTDFDYHRARTTTEKRFVEFVQNNGHLIQRVPQKYLASYLGIKPETFSRMKHLIRNRADKKEKMRQIS
ncbi:MAG TPA: Crp/Fnr family transcriptional regulator [Candidatus Paceibacterota bacterium]|nr:Crp/Fnr family transcriptional regulator [Candidatus Paceibacterota bacterium]